MKRELKIGDKVRINKPKNWKETCWVEGMEKFIGKELIINSIYCKMENTAHIFPLSSLTLVEEATEQVTEQVTEQPTEQVAKQIDWEQRRWEMASRLFSLTSHEQAITSADNFIEQYKQTLK